MKGEILSINTINKLQKLKKIESLLKKDLIEYKDYIKDLQFINDYRKDNYPIVYYKTECLICYIEKLLKLLEE